mmetsp:Transcript_69526/g.226466  ORF Transcript_69526/g.226466 Transcript_69526/m.226466 type:complete len:207 (+) Transcript_69526:768-1388(+)
MLSSRKRAAVISSCVTIFAFSCASATLLTFASGGEATRCAPLTTAFPAAISSWSALGPSFLASFHHRRCSCTLHHSVSTLTSYQTPLSNCWLFACLTSCILIKGASVSAVLTVLMVLMLAKEEISSPKGEAAPFREKRGGLGQRDCEGEQIGDGKRDADGDEHKDESGLRNFEGGVATCGGVANESGSADIGQVAVQQRPDVGGGA